MDAQLTPVIALLTICCTYVSGQLTAPQLNKFRSRGVTVTDDGDSYTFSHVGVPTDHAYGPFPADGNPNSVSNQNHEVKIPKTPIAVEEYGCLNMGPIAMAVNGIPIYNPFTAEGTNAIDNEIFDDCDGHPDFTGTYHYHQLPSCLYKGNEDELLGVAFDGYPIYGPKTSGGVELTTADLDVCHGREVDRKYEYRITKDFPYILGCFHGATLMTQGGRMMGPGGEGAGGSMMGPGGKEGEGGMMDPGGEGGGGGMMGPGGEGGDGGMMGHGGEGGGGGVMGPGGEGGGGGMMGPGGEGGGGGMMGPGGEGGGGGMMGPGGEGGEDGMMGPGGEGGGGGMMGPGGEGGGGGMMGPGGEGGGGSMMGPGGEGGGGGMTGPGGEGGGGGMMGPGGGEWGEHGMGPDGENTWSSCYAEVGCENPIEGCRSKSIRIAAGLLTVLMSLCILKFLND